ncbi:hypothetical protein HYX58_04860 [Candidatus Dependentiae bacterium]|nr:hypothetical protein [Candidatus Dependentiae bacterium]
MKLMHQLTLILLAITYSVANANPPEINCVIQRQSDSVKQITSGTIGVFGLILTCGIYATAQKLNQNNYPCASKTVALIGHSSAALSAIFLAGGFAYGTPIIRSEECARQFGK